MPLPSPGFELTQTSGDLLLPVRAQPGAKREGLVGIQNGQLKFAVRVPPEDGKANAALVEVIASTFSLRRSDVTLVRGATSRQKVFRLQNANEAAIRQRASALLPSEPPE